MDQAEEGLQAIGLASSWESDELERYADWKKFASGGAPMELHQFKPTVLDEVDFTLHYFQEVLFDVIPQLYQRFCRALQQPIRCCNPPKRNFCKFGSWSAPIAMATPRLRPKSPGKRLAISAIWCCESILPPSAI